jgi:trans-aconitate methyltransferase
MITYNKLAKTYIDDFNYSFIDTKVHNSILLDLINIDSRNNIIEVGPGSGRTFNNYAKLAPQKIHGVERDSAMFDELKRNNPESFVYNSDFMDFDSELRFDLFIFIMSFHQINYHFDTKQIIDKISSLNHTGGEVIINTVNPSHFNTNVVTKYFPSALEVDKKRYPSIESLIADFSNCGYELIYSLDIESSIKYPMEEYSKLLKKRYISSLQYVGDAELNKGIEKFKKEYNGILPDYNTYLKFKKQ